MLKRKKRVEKKVKKNKQTLKWVEISNRWYGGSLIGTKVFYEGKKPKRLKGDGSSNFGKPILELLKRKYKKFWWIITPDIDSIKMERGIARVRTSVKLLARMDNEQRSRTTDIKHDIINKMFSVAFPLEFSSPVSPLYVPGSLSGILDKKIITKLSAEDRNALNTFLPDFISSESVSSVNLLKATVEIESLRELAKDLENQILDGHTESWWQIYIKKNILLIQQGYIKAIEKMNISIGNTKFPDFSLITHDNFLDILEIKKPDTKIIKLDSSRDNYHWDIEMSKAVIQVENYIANISAYQDAVRSYIFDNYNKLNIKAVRPRGIILAGDARNFVEQKEKDDFRLLSQGLKNITILTYDELLIRLKNYIKVLEEFSKNS